MISLTYSMDFVNNKHDVHFHTVLLFFTGLFYVMTTKIKGNQIRNEVLKHKPVDHFR